MKRILTILPIIAAALLCGCSTVQPYLTPAALTKEVSKGIQVGLDVYPTAAPDVAMARDVICSEASKGTVSPQAIVTDLENLGITNRYSMLIINGGLLVYEGVFALVSTNTSGQMLLYDNALCAGFTQGLPPASARASVQPILPPHLK